MYKGFCPISWVLAWDNPRAEGMFHGKTWTSSIYLSSVLRPPRVVEGALSTRWSLPWDPESWPINRYLLDKWKINKFLSTEDWWRRHELEGNNLKFHSYIKGSVSLSYYLYTLVAPKSTVLEPDPSHFSYLPNWHNLNLL